MTDDIVTAYARDVAEGRIVAGPHVRAAAARHLRDLETGEARGLRWNAEEAERICAVFRDLYQVEVNGDLLPFNPLDWQAFIVGSIWGWQVWSERFERWVRRFREAYVETGKGSGKSPLAAAIGLTMQAADGEASAEVYAFATKRDQAMVLFRDAVKMVEASPLLNFKMKQYGGGYPDTWKLTYKPTGAFFMPLAKDGADSGPRPHCGLGDEIHEHPNGHTIEMIRRGFKGRPQPLLFLITNSGSDVETVCYELHDHAIKVAHGDVEDDAFFSYVCALDEGDEPFTDEGCWPKANPSLGQTIDHDYLRRAVKSAKDLPSTENEVLRLNFCQWTDAPDGWMTRAVWAACEHEIALDDYVGRECVCGLDLSYSDDLTALAIVFPWTREGREGAQETVYDLFVEFWKPADVLTEHANRHRFPYQKMLGRELTAPPGPRLKLAPVARRLAELQERFDLIRLGYDKYRIKDLETDLEAEGVDIPMIEHAQGFRRPYAEDAWKDSRDPNKRRRWQTAQLWMPSSVQEMENAAVEGRFRTPGNRLLRWNVMSATAKHDAAGVGNKILDKRRSLGKIDGAVAAAMGIGLAQVIDAMRPRRSAYETRRPAVVG